MQVQANGFTYTITNVVDNDPIVNFDVDVTDASGTVVDQKAYWFNKSGDASLDDQALAKLQSRFSGA